ncbi:extracellular solute-binding protein [Lactobacillus sp. ESL0791]|uniref:ABC transporter substrate-binding protein n=1 Tax=Lactobacillus sp. ESL0791 TaxID=2983234 RepID=UPI0023F89811|nr:extracellular solute-binding protein [Lactobacillus sp. ESL0791]MDF7638110.1 extracellular solute-binding protein [Lactobacillus sp. ESL0791]
MNKSRKRLSLIGLFLLLIIGLGIWDSHIHQQKKTLTIGIYTSSSWNVPNGQQYHIIDYAIKKFKRNHPNIKVEYESGIQLDDYRNWLSEKIIENKMPDLVIVPSHDFNLLASEGAFKNLTPLMNRDKIAPNTFYQSTLQAGQYNNQQLALPYEANPTLMVMNKTLLKKLRLTPPKSSWTPRKFYQLCHQVTHKRKKGKYYGVTSSYSWQDAQLAYGSSLFAKGDNSVQLTSARAHRGFALSEDLTNDASSDNVTSQLFDKGQVTFMPLGLAQYRTYTSYPFYVTRDNNFLWECTKMPGTPGVKSTPMETSMFAISSKAKNSEMAWQFMKLLCTNKDVQRELMQTNMGASVLPSVIKSRQAQNILDDKVINYHNLTVTKLDEIMRSGAVNPKFKDYNNKLETLDYKIQNALKAGNLETQLFNIQLQVNQSQEK